jgi:WD40 repeat protein
MRQFLLPYDARSTPCLAWLPDGLAVLLGQVDGTVAIWDVAARAERGRLRAHAGLVSALAPSPAGDRLITGGSDGRVHEWDLGALDKAPTVLLELGAPVVALAGRADGVVAATDGRRVVRSDGERVARSPIRLERLMWYDGMLVGGGDELVRLHEDEPFVMLSEGRVLSYHWNADEWLNLLGLSTGVVLDLDKREPVAEAGAEVLCWSAAMATAFSLLAAGAADGRVLLHLYPRGSGPVGPFASWQAHQGAVLALACAPDGSAVVSVGADGQIALWTQGQAAPVELDAPGAGHWIELDVSPSGELAVTGFLEVVVPQGPRLRVQEQMWGGFGAAAWTPDGTLVTADDEDAWVRRFDRSGTQIAAAPQQGWFRRGLAVAGDGRIAVSNPRGIRLLDTSLQETGWLAPDREICALAWSRAGALAGLDRSGLLTVWAPTTGQELLVHRCQDTTEQRHALSWSPDGRWLAVAGRPALVLELATQQVVCELPPSQSVAFAPDGRWLALGTWTQIVTVWDWRQRQVVAWRSLVEDGPEPPLVAWRSSRELLVLSKRHLTSWSLSPFGEH